MRRRSATRWQQARRFPQEGPLSVEFPDETVQQVVSVLAELLLGTLFDDTTVTPRGEHDAGENQS
jgi:hypothetical protein